MTNTPTEEREVEPADTATPVPASSTTPAPPAPEPVPFWQRPLVERFLVPLVLPVAVVVGLVAYVLNISRIFLSGHGHIPVIVGSVITVLILLGATLLAAGSDKLRGSAFTLVGAAFILAIFSAGWLVVGSAQPKETGPSTLPETLKVTQPVIPVTAAPGGRLAFAPSQLTAKTGLAKIEVTVAGAGHTFTMQDPTTLFAQLDLNAAGTKVSGIAFFEKPGSYTFFCSIPGHEAAGMKGSIRVTGPPVTLQKALTDAGNPPGAVPGG
jgi:plastocyanin